MAVDDTGIGSGLAREIERVADRLRVLSPRWAARSAGTAAGPGTGAGAGAGPAGDDVVPTEAVSRVYAVLQVLADLAADADGRPRRPVPRLAAHALADQVLVLGHDLAAVAGTEPKLAGQRALVGLRRAL